MTEYYKEMMEKGLQYQDFVVEKLLRNGIIVQMTSSRKYQNEVGESFSGVEIKYDSMYSSTGNLYIEMEEKSRPDIETWTKSGVYRNDNSYLYAIGDYSNIFLLNKNALLGVASSLKDEGFRTRQDIRLVEKETSKGFLLKLGSALYKWLLVKRIKA